MGTSRTTLRRAIGRLCGDILVGTATATGTTSTFIDTINFVASDDALIGRVAYWVSSASGTTNNGTTRRVSDNDEAAGSITVSTAWSAASAVGDVVELFAARSVSPGPQEIHDKINDVIRSVAEMNLTVVDGAAVEFDMDDPYLDIPAGWIGYTKAMYQDTWGVWQLVPKADTLLHTAFGAYGQVEIKNTMRVICNAADVKLFGVTSAPELSTDSATTIINPDWLVKQAAGELLIQNARVYEDTPGAERRGNLWLQQAAALYPKAQSRPPANFQRLTRS